jgi:hypothetical protein
MEYCVSGAVVGMHAGEQLFFSLMLSSIRPIIPSGEEKA